jgi:hypothetical protein
MSRWLIAFVFAVLLPCYGLAAVAPTVSFSSQDEQQSHGRGTVQQVLADSSALSDASCEEPAHVQVENPADTAELVEGPARIDALGVRPASPSQLKLTELAPPFLATPKRPPR